MPTMLFTAFQKYANFSGRARRKEYWQFVMLTLVVGVIASILDSVLGLKRAWGTGAIASLANLVFLLPSLSVTVRRLHDVNKTGWWVAIPVITLIISGMSLGIFGIASLGDGIASPGASMCSLGGYSLIVFGISNLALLAVSIYVFVLVLTDGTWGPNRFGPNPKVQIGDLAETFA